ncbi:hypothetical protein KC968_04675 [Candidatus Saccharibacteria bacterium]|nr:hypothetical protein [Candidatus Saccharibacteria bacterium]
MEAFWAITLSAILISRALRPKKPPQDELSRNTVKARWDRKRIKADKLKQQADAARKAERERQKRQDAEELITVIMPTIQNDGK